MLNGAPTLAVPLNVPTPMFFTVKLFVTLVPANTVPYDVFPGVTRITGVVTSEYWYAPMSQFPVAGLALPSLSVTK